jgi:large-conductance mechanosensitive channel
MNNTTNTPAQKPPNSSIPVIKKNTQIINQVIITSLGLTSGFALKTLVQSFVFDILEPLTYNIFSFTKYTSKIISKNDQKLKLITFLSNLVSFIFIILIVYFIITKYLINL